MAVNVSMSFSMLGFSAPICKITIHVNYMTTGKQSNPIREEYLSVAGSHLQQNSNHSESIGFVRSVSKACIFGVPVHQMELVITKDI